MDCPKCQTLLMAERYQGVEVDKCPDCNGMWLDHPELDELEDTVYSDDRLKGLMEYAHRESDIACPVCGEGMTTFNYRAYKLPIDYCALEHGFWLDSGEEDRVLELMRQRIKDIDRSGSAEVDWAHFLARAGTKSFFDRLKGLFRG